MIINPNFILVDFSWLYSRSKFAFKDLSFESEGVNYATGSIYGVHDTIFAMIEYFGRDIPIYLVMDGTPMKHMKASSNYKAGREKEEGGLGEVIQLSRFDVAHMFTILPNIYMYWHSKMEADESIAFKVKTKEPDEVCLIMSGDGDLRALISSENGVYCTTTYERGKGFDIEDENTLWEHGIKGLDHLKPEAVALYLSIVGDSSDGVSGIPRFLTAVAKNIANQAVNLSGLEAMVQGIDNYKEAKMVKGLTQIKENWGQVKLNWKLVNMDPLFIPYFGKERNTDIDIFLKYGCVKVFNDLSSLI